MNHDYTLTNAGTVEVFLPGPNASLAVGESVTWEDVSRDDLAENTVVQGYIEDGTITVSGGTNTVAQLATFTGLLGQWAYASDGRKTGEGGGAGTGLPVYYSDSPVAGWYRAADDTVVVA